MKITREDASPTKISLKIQADSTDLKPIHTHVLTHFAHSSKIPGFRKGKAPASLVEKQVDQQAVLDEFMEHALNTLYKQAAQQQKIRPVSLPDVKLKKFVPYTQLDFEVETEILGPIKLPDYKKITLAKVKPTVTTPEVNNVIKNLQERLAERLPAERAAKTGDEIVIDFAGQDTSGKTVPGADGKDFPIILGSQSFIPGFEDNLIGTKTNQDKEFKITFPKDYGVAGLRSKPVTFKVKVKKVNEVKQPKVDDAFAKKAGPFNSVVELKADIKKQLLSEKQNKSQIEYQNELVRKIVEKTQIDVPQSLVTEENLRLEEQEKQNLAYRGQTWQEHLQLEAVTEEEHRARHLPEALERVKVGLILSEIAEREGISVSPEELSVRLQLLKGQYNDPQMQSELDKETSQRDIEARFLTEKTLEKLVGYASKTRN